MATIKNSRDIALQAVAVRITTSSLLINSDGGTFTKGKNNGSVLPAAITLTAVPTSVYTGPFYSWEYSLSTSPNIWTPVGTDSDELIISNTDFSSYVGSSSSVNYRVTVSQVGLETVRATYIVYYVKEADEPIQIQFSNAAVTVAGNSSGVVSDFTNTGTTIRVLRGVTYLTYGTTGANTFSIAASPTISPVGAVTLPTPTTSGSTYTVGNLTAFNSAINNASASYSITVRDASGVAVTGFNPISVLQYFTKVSGVGEGAIEVVSGTLPTTGNYDGRIVYFTDDKKLYKHNGVSWVAIVNTTDLVGTISTAQIADAALTTAKFASTIQPITIVTGVPGTKITGIDVIYDTTTRKIYRWDGSAYVASIPGADIVAGSIGATSLVPTIKAIEVLAALPGTPHVEGRMVYLTTDTKLYRNTGSGWIAEVAATDITGTLTNDQIAALEAAKLTGQITTTQITDDAITTPKVAAGAITAAEIAANTITAGQIAANTITAGQIAANAITASELAADAVTAGKILAGTITADRLAANTITADQIAANAITASELAADAVTANKILAGTITGDKIAANTITAGQIAAAAISTDELAANSITANKLVLSDTSNIVPDNDLRADDSWSGVSAWVTAPSNSWRSGRVARLDGASDQYVFMYSQVFTVEPGQKYYTAFQGQILAGSGNVIANLQLSASPTMSSPTYTTFGGVSATSLTEVASIATIPAGYRYARIRFYKNNTGATSCYVGGPIVRRAASAELIVDGSISTIKLAAEAVTAAKIAANTITATQIASNTLTSDQIVAGGITAASIETNTITADKMSIGVLSENLLYNGSPDIDELGIAGWYISEGASSNFSATDTVIGGMAPRRFNLSKATLATQTAWSARPFAVVPGQSYVFRFTAGADSTTTSGRYIRVTYTNNLAVSGEITQSNRTGYTELVASNSGWAGGITNYEYIWTCPKGVKFATLSIYSWTNGPLNLYLDNFEVYCTTGATLIRPGSIYSDSLVANSITAGQIATNTITSAQIASNTITAAQIAANTITAGQIATSTITSAQIASNTITAAQIAANTITANEIAANAITTSELASNSVTAAKIVANTITAAQIAANTITAAQIASKSITAEKLAIYDFQGIIPNGNFQTQDFTNWFSIPAGYGVFPRGLSSGSSNAPTAYVMQVDASVQNAGPFASEQFFDAKEGDTFLISLESARDDLTFTNNTIRGLVYYKKADGTTNSFSSFYFNPTTTWTKYTGVVGPAPADTVGVRFRIFRNTHTNTSTIWVTNLECRKRNAGELVVDGSISANQINATGLTIKNASNVVLLNAAGNSPIPWVQSLASSGVGVSLVEAPNSATNTSLLRTIKTGNNINIVEETGSITISAGDSTKSIRLGTEFTTTLQSFPTIDGFFLPLEINSTYLVKGYFRVKTAAATTGAWIGLFPPDGTDKTMVATARTGATTAQTRGAYEPSGGGAVAAYFYDHQANINASDTFSSTAYSLVEMTAILITGGTAGILRVGASSEISGSSISIGAGSIITTQKIDQVTATTTTALVTSPANGGLLTSYTDQSYQDGKVSTAKVTLTIKTNKSWSIVRQNGTTETGNWLNTGDASSWDVLFDVTASTRTADVTRSNSAATYSQVTTDKAYYISVSSPSSSGTLREGTSTVAVRFRNRVTNSVTTLQTIALSVSAESDYSGGAVPY